MTERIAVRYAGGEHLISPTKPHAGRGFTIRVGIHGLVQFDASFITASMFSPQHIPDLIDALREAHRIAMRPEPSDKDEAAK